MELLLTPMGTKADVEFLTKKSRGGPSCDWRCDATAIRTDEGTLQRNKWPLLRPQLAQELPSHHSRVATLWSGGLEDERPASVHPLR